MKSTVLALGIAAALTGTPALSQISIGVGLPSISIGLNLPVMPQLALVPGYPVYYAPSVGGNLFFYDGLYWSLNDDHWYSSSWYNGPWSYVDADAVPEYLWRVPVRYYRRPPAYFAGWRRDEPPRWGEHWGHDWEDRHHDWDHWDRRGGPRPAPVPDYQRQYRGERYPRPEEQEAMHRQYYHYEHQDPVVRERVYGHDGGRGHEEGRGHDEGHGHDRGNDR